MLAFKAPSFYLIISPNRRSSDADNSHMPERSHIGLPSSEKVRVLLDLINEGKKLYAEVAQISGRTNLLSVKCKEGKVIPASLAVAPETAKVLANGAW